MSALALRSILQVDALDTHGLETAARGNADAVLLDLASAGAYEQRANARRSAHKAAEALSAAGRVVFARVSDYRSEETEGDIQSIVRANLSAIVLAASVEPQDSRAIDVAIRKQEMRRGIEPGTVRLIAEIDSAAGLRMLPASLAAIDRHSAVALDISAFARDLILPGSSAMHLSLLEHVMSEIAVVCAAADVAWLISAPGIDSGTRAALATTGHAYGAAGMMIASDAEAQGFNRLFALDVDAVAAARVIAAEWEALRKRGEQTAVVDGHIVDRRTKDHARMLIARADAIAARDRIAVR